MEPVDRDPTRYGRSFADVYDEWYGDSFDTATTVDAIRRLAGGGAVLELGAGTGRLALPLAAAGLEVVALDAADEMLERLRRRDPDGRVVTVRADMADIVAVDRRGLLGERRFAVAVCACSSILNLPDTDAIGRCLASAATVLTADGVLVVEAVVPADDVPATTLSPARVASDTAVFVETRFDPSTGRVSGRHVEVADGRVVTRPWAVVLVTPARLDELSATAGLRLRDRWADWSGTSFDDGCGTHVSIYERRA